MQRKLEKLKAESLVKHKEPPQYEGKLVKEHTDWLYACNLVFWLKPYTYDIDETCILWVSTFLKGKAMEQWKQYERDHGEDKTSWAIFTDKLLDWVQTPANWNLSYAEKYEKAEQQLGQDVRQFAVYLQGTEDVLSDTYTEQQRIRHFLAKIKPEISRGVAALETAPTVWEDAVEAAARIEENLKAGQREKTVATTQWTSKDTTEKTPKGTSTGYCGNRSSRGGRGGYANRRITSTPGPSSNRQGAVATPATKPNNAPVQERGQDLSEITCWGCGKKGHYQSNCPTSVAKVNTATTTVMKIEEVDTSDEGPAQKRRRSKKGKGPQQNPQ